MSELRTILGNIQQLCALAGAETAAKELQTFSDILKPYSDAPVDKACADIKHYLSQSKSAKRGKAAGQSSGSLDQNAIQRHLTELRAAGIDEQAFDLAWISTEPKLPNARQRPYLFRSPL